MSQEWGEIWLIVTAVCFDENAYQHYTNSHSGS